MALLVSLLWMLFVMVVGFAVILRVRRTWTRRRAVVVVTVAASVVLPLTGWLVIRDHYAQWGKNFVCRGKLGELSAALGNFREKHDRFPKDLKELAEAEGLDERLVRCAYSGREYLHNFAVQKGPRKWLLADPEPHMYRGLLSPVISKRRMWLVVGPDGMVRKHFSPVKPPQ